MHFLSCHYWTAASHYCLNFHFSFPDWVEAHMYTCSYLDAHNVHMHPLTLTGLNCCAEPWRGVPAHVAFILGKTNSAKSLFTLPDGHNLNKDTCEIEGKGSQGHTGNGHVTRCQDLTLYGEFILSNKNSLFFVAYKEMFSIKWQYCWCLIGQTKCILLF